MKKNIWAAALLLILPATMMQAADTLTLAQVKSSVTMPLGRQGRMECNVTGDYPSGASQELRTAFNRWARGVVSRVMGDKVTGADVFPLFSFCEDRFMSQVASGKAQNVTLDLQEERIYETSQIITFRIHSSYYKADGSIAQGNELATFVKASGRLLTWGDVINKKSKAKFSKLLLSNIQGFFGVKGLDNLKPRLNSTLKYSATDFPFPTCGPAFTADGLQVQYAGGEIAAESAGQPSVLLSYSSVSGCLTPAAKKYER